MVTRSRPGDPPCAPTAEQWAALSEDERARVVDSLPASIPAEELAPPEGDQHFDAKSGAREVLRSFFGKLGRRIYVACELTVYYPGEARFAPDLLAVRDVDPHERMKWVVSAEGKGLDLVMEVHVAGDWRKDLERNVALCARLGIPEYFVYDRGHQRLHGWRLGPAGGYEPIPAQAGRLGSHVLGLELVIEDGRLRFYEGTAALLEPGELVARMERMVGQLESSADARVAEARQEGELRGRQEGELRGRQEACLALLRARLGEVPVAVRARVQAIMDPAALERLLVALGLAADAAAVPAILGALAEPPSDPH
ncbi:MAG TPA: Uma2 family endonuclease [Polyangia bacterium]|jgi:Uma2 family endonuclease